VNKGLIFDIRRFSVHDGPGIRTTVFFKGCPLTCWWCHNPESRAEVPEKTVRHLALEGKKFPVEETTGRYMSIEEVLSEALKDRLFYEESKGGVTLSGGEPMLQAEFAAGLLSALKEAGIHTAMDTCGQVRQEDLEMVIPHVDLFLFDLKLMDEKEHFDFTGVSNKLIHDNLLFLVRSGKQAIIRFPVIPGITDSRRNIDLMKEFLMRLQPSVSRIHLLPFHSFGGKKYERLNLANKLKGVKDLGREDLVPLQKEFEKLGFEVFIGG
jgi:pyruvate formate lyase activating enzyme